jgi:hypothetical protein
MRALAYAHFPAVVGHGKHCDVAAVRILHERG